jgi:hypothetical protein
MTGPRPLDDGAKVGWGLLAIIVAFYMALVVIAGAVTTGLRKVLRAWLDR